MVTGDIASGIGNFSWLSSLSMSHNQLKGSIPSELCSLKRMFYLDLSNNGLAGTIPSSCYNSSSLTGLKFHNNFLSGIISNGFSRNSKLITLDLSDNQLSGGIPLSIGHLSQLQVLLLAHNSLHGELPTTLCHLGDINIIDMSSNDIFGGIPTCFANMTFGSILPKNVYTELKDHVEPLTRILTFRRFFNEIPRSLDQEVVTLSTKSRYIDYEGYILGMMSALDLSCNRLTGKIPTELGKWNNLQALNLSHNELSGPIPSSISMLTSIESLDLSNNSLSGALPPQMDQISSLEIFNVSYNNLSGMVPQTGQFANFDESNYEGNPLLCGYVGKSCGRASKGISPYPEKDKSTHGFDWTIFFWSFGMSAVTLFLATLVVLWIYPQWCRPWFLFLDLHVLWWLY